MEGAERYMTMDLDIVTNKIVDKYISNGEDLNASIAKYAEDHSLNIEQTKRLIEKSNQATYLAKFAQDGTQVFDVADFDKVKSIIKIKDNTIEKKASVNVGAKIEVNYNQNNVYGYDMEKTASTEFSLQDINDAIDLCTSKIAKSMTKIADSYTSEKNNYNFESLDKFAEENSSSGLKNIEHYTKIREALMTKKASIITGLAKASAGAALKGGSNLAGFVAKAPMNRGLMPLMYTQSAVAGAKRTLDEGTKAIGNVTKTASIYDEAKFVLRESAPLLLVSGALGVTGFAASKMGGLVGQMFEQRQLNESFGNMMSANKDLENIPNARAYYDVIGRHAPDLAKDPMVAPQLIRQFDSFDGVDIQTVGKLREIQNEGERNKMQGLGFNEYTNIVGGGMQHGPLMTQMTRANIEDKRLQNMYKTPKEERDVEKHNREIGRSLTNFLAKARARANKKPQFQAGKKFHRFKKP